MYTVGVVTFIVGLVGMLAAAVYWKCIFPYVDRHKHESITEGKLGSPYMPLYRSYQRKMRIFRRVTWLAAVAAILLGAFLAWH